MGKINDKEYQIGLYEKSIPNEYSFAYKLSCAREHGYDFLEMSIDETDEKLSRLDMPKTERKELTSLMLDQELPIRTICLSGHRKYPLGSPSAKTREQSLEIMKKAILLSCDLGVRVIQLAGYDVYYEPSTEKTRELFEENLIRSVEMAAAYGVILAFETMETPFMDTVEKAMYYVNRVNSPYLQVYPDIGNCTNAAKLYKHSVVEDLRSGRGHLAGMHLKETVPGKYRDIPYGSGHVDFPEAIRTAWDLGVRYFVTEFWNTSLAPHEIHIRQSKEFIDRMIAKALD